MGFATGLWREERAKVVQDIPRQASYNWEAGVILQLEF